MSRNRFFKWLSAALFCLLSIAAPARAEEEAKQQESVIVGVYLKELPGIDVKSNTYVADFYLWFRWKGPLDPTKTWEFVNGVEPVNTSKVAVYNEPDKLDDGWLYQVYHVQGKFTHPFDLKDYPFDEQDVTIEMEDAQHSLSELKYELEKDQTTYEPHINVPGWELRQINSAISETTYKTNFGDPRVKAGEDKYSRLVFSIHIGRPIRGYIIKTILPISLVILITFVAFLIGASHFDARLGLGITSLISAVALQLTAVSDLPSVGYMVLLDKVYNISYLTIFLTLLESVVAVRIHDGGNPQGARTLDKISLAVGFVLFFGGTLLIIALRQ